MMYSEELLACMAATLLGLMVATPSSIESSEDDPFRYDSNITTTLSLDQMRASLTDRIALMSGAKKLSQSKPCNGTKCNLCKKVKEFDDNPNDDPTSIDITMTCCDVGRVCSACDEDELEQIGCGDADGGGEVQDCSCAIDGINFTVTNYMFSSSSCPQNYSQVGQGGSCCYREPAVVIEGETNNQFDMQCLSAGGPGLANCLQITCLQQGSGACGDNPCSSFADHVNGKSGGEPWSDAFGTTHCD